MITVFLADDHPIVRDGLRFLINAQEDMRVVGEAEHGRAAVAAIETLQPDIAVLDIVMPELNGIDAAAQIETVSPETRVIILSMYATLEHIFRALRVGARGYLLKESVGAEVIEAIRAVYQGNRYLTQEISDKLIDTYVQQRAPSDDLNRLERLSTREHEVLQLVVEGYASAQIADTLSLSIKTVDTYRSRIMQKLDIYDLPGLVKFAIRHGMIGL